MHKIHTFMAFFTGVLISPYPLVIAAVETWLDGQPSIYIFFGVVCKSWSNELRSLLNVAGIMLNKSRVWSLQLVSFLVGLRTYQHPGISSFEGRVPDLMHRRLLSRDEVANNKMFVNIVMGLFLKCDQENRTCNILTETLHIWGPRQHSG